MDWKQSTGHALILNSRSGSKPSAGSCSVIAHECSNPASAKLRRHRTESGIHRTRTEADRQSGADVRQGGRMIEHEVIFDGTSEKPWNRPSMSEFWVAVVEAIHAVTG